jgi:hypothetical protein
MNSLLLLLLLLLLQRRDLFSETIILSLFLFFANKRTIMIKEQKRERERERNRYIPNGISEAQNPRASSLDSRVVSCFFGFMQISISFQRIKFQP